jgi:hypothetical protein
MKKIKQRTIDDIIYFAGGGRENLLIKVRGRGWFLSSGGNDVPGLTLTLLDGWLREADDFERVKVQHFHIEKGQKNPSRAPEKRRSARK